MAHALHHLVNAIPLAALYAALAAAYALPFGIHRRADFSFGALHAFAGQMLVLFAAFGWGALWLTLPSTIAFGAGAALLVTAFAAAIIARHIVAPLARAHPNTMLATSLGTMIVLMELARIASRARSHWLPPFFNQPIDVPGLFGLTVAPPVTLTAIQLGNTALLAFLALGAHLLIARASFGRSWAAVRDDPLAAALCGINPARILALAYGTGVAIAALAGLLNTAWLGNMDFGASLTNGLKLVFLAAIGGALSPGAAALGGAGLAVAETLWSALAPLVWRDVFVYGLLICVLVLRGRGALADQ